MPYSLWRLNKLQSVQTATIARPSHKVRNIVVGVVVVIIAVIALIMLGGFLASPTTQYPQVSVSGTVTTVGFGTSPIRVDFTSSSGTTYSAQVTNGVYSLTLPNGQNYSILVTYQTALGISTGTCNAGALNLNANANTLTYNTSC